MSDLLFYQPTLDDDTLLLKWYAHLINDGEFQTTFQCASGQPWALGKFITSFQNSTLLMEVDGEGITMAAWFSPAFSGAFFGLWVRKDRRHLRENLPTLYRILDAAFLDFPVIFSVTCQEKVLELERRLGYTVLAEVPGLWVGHTAWIAMLTKAGLDAARVKESHHG